MVGLWGAVLGINSTAHIYTQMINNGDGVLLFFFFPQDFLHAAPCRVRLLCSLPFLFPHSWQNIGACKHETPFVGGYLYTSLSLHARR